MAQIFYQFYQFIIPNQIIFLFVSSIVIALLGVFMSKSLNSKKEVLLAKINNKIITEIDRVSEVKSEINQKFKDREQHIPDYVLERLERYNSYHNSLINYQLRIQQRPVKDKFGVRDLEKIEENLELFDTIYEKRMAGRHESSNNTS